MKCCFSAQNARLTVQGQHLVHEKWKLVIPETAVAFWLCVCMSVEAKGRRFQCWKVNWNERWQPLETVSAKKDYFQQKTEICPLDWADVQSKSVGQCVISATARARAPDATRVWCFILLLACKSLVVSFASPCKLYLRSLLQWGNDSLLKSTA